MSRAFIGVFVFVAVAAGVATVLDLARGFVLVTWLTSSFYVASLIQNDSPYRSDALWPGKPLYSGAVFTAKLLIAGAVVIAFPLAVHAATLLIGIDAVPPHLSDQLIAAAAFAMVSAFGAAVYAAITPNLRTFFLLQCAVLVFENMFAAWRVNTFGREDRYLGETPFAISTLVAVVLQLAIVAWMYHSRNRAHGILLACAAWLLTAFGAFDVDIGRKAGSTLPPSERAGTVIVELPSYTQKPRQLNADAERTGEYDILVGLRDFDPSRSYRLVMPTAQLVYEDGHTERARVMRQSIALNDAVPTVPDAAWLEVGWWPPSRQPNQPEANRRAVVPVRLSQAQQSAVNAARARLTLHGRVEVNELALVATLPLDSGRVVTAAGERIEIAGVSQTGSQLTVKVRGVDLSTDRGSEFGSSEPEFGVLNRRRGESIPLFNKDGASGTYGVLPTRFNNHSYERQLSILSPDRQLEVPASWYERVELLRFRKRHIGSYPIIAEAVPERPNPSY